MMVQGGVTITVLWITGLAFTVSTSSQPAQDNSSSIAASRITDSPNSITELNKVEPGSDVEPPLGNILPFFPEVATSVPSTQEPFVLQVGNITVSDVCNMAENVFKNFVHYYPSHCVVDYVNTSAATDVKLNESDRCQGSADLPAKGAAEREHLSSLSIFLILCVLGICVLAIYFLLRTKLNYLPESVACVLIGALIGLVLNFMYHQNIANWQQEETFSPTVFFLVILPPIIFESGYNLHKGNFFQNIGSILTFAILGTVISAIVIGSGVYLLGQADVVYRLTFVESFAFGSLISAVDPVATLAIFHALNVDQVLYMLVFGESILNDAVSIVLTSTVLELASPAMANISSGEALVYGLWRFCVMFFASAGIGVLFALLSALTLKYIAVRDFASLELCIVLIFIYAPYTLAEGMQLSGIMAILFNGIVMSQYTHFNLSPVMQITMQHLMRTLAFIAECTVFIYLGLAIFSFHHEFHGALVVWSVVLCLIGRGFNIFPLSWAVNHFRDHKITPRMMFVMWFSGLRGAIAYALSLHLEFPDEKHRVLVTTTLLIVLFTIFILGGSTMPLIKYVKADKKKARRHRTQVEKELTLSKTREWGQAIDSEYLSEYTEEESDSLHEKEPLTGFLKWDIHFFRPFLVRKVSHQEVRNHASDLKKQCYQSLNVQASESEEDLFVAPR